MICFIGYGQMADAIALGIHQCALNYTVVAVEPNEHRLAWIGKERPFIQLMSLDDAVMQCNILFLAVKPQQVHNVAQQLSQPIQ